MKYLFPLFMVLLCNFLALAGAHAVPSGTQGISFYVLRVIYPESERKNVTLTVNNKSAVPYLLQSWIRPVNLKNGGVDLNYTGQPKMPFIVTPPLERLEAKNDLTLRIRRNGEPLPTDRESVFYISMKAIPANKRLDNTELTGHMAVTVVSNIKLFYRPEGLAKRAVEDAAPRLHFRLEGRQLIAENPTPYWLTFSQLKIGDTALDKPALRLMVPPKGQQYYVLPHAAKGDVLWQLIDEDGWDTEPHKQPVSLL